MRIILSLVLSLFCGAALAQNAPAQKVPDQTPEELIRFVYKHYVDTKSTDETDFHWESPPLVEQLFEPALAAAIVKVTGRDDPVIDYDPFVSAQDFEIKSYELKVEQRSADRSRIAASFENFGQGVTVRYDLVRLASGWRIYDILGDDGQTSLRKTAELP